MGGDFIFFSCCIKKKVQEQKKKHVVATCCPSYSAVVVPCRGVSLFPAAQHKKQSEVGVEAVYNTPAACRRSSCSTMNKPGRSYGSVEDYCRKLRFSSARPPVIHNQHQNLQPKLDEGGCVCQFTKQRARCAVGAAMVLGLMLGGYGLGSKVASARGGTSSDLAAVSEAHTEVRCVLNVFTN